MPEPAPRADAWPSPARTCPSDGRTADQREEALRLPRVGHEAGESPDRQAQEELRRAAEEPQGGVDPVRARGQDHPGRARDEGDRRGDREERPSAPEPSEQDGDPERREEHRDPEEEVQDGQFVDPAAGEQERVDAARGERQTGRRQRTPRRRRDPPTRRSPGNSPSSRSMVGYRGRP